MAVKLILRKADLEILAEAAQELDAVFRDKKLREQWASFYQRVELARLAPPKKPSVSISVNGAIEIFRGVLGKRLVLPAGNPGAGWFAPLQKRLNDSGLTKEHCEAAAKVAAVMWKGPIKAESIIRQCDVLLSDANMESVGGMLPEPAPDMAEL